MNDMKYLKYMYNSSEAQETVVNNVMMTNPVEGLNELKARELLNLVWEKRSLCGRKIFLSVKHQ